MGVFLNAFYKILYKKLATHVRSLNYLMSKEVCRAFVWQRKPCTT